MGRIFFLLLSIALAQAKGNRANALSLMYDAWIASPSPMPSDKKFKQQQSGLIESYLREVATDAKVDTYDAVTNLAHGKIDKLIDSLRAAKILENSANIDQLNAELLKLHTRLYEALAEIAQNSSDPDREAYTQFLEKEKKALPADRTAPQPTDSAMPKELWNSIMNDSHSEVVVRMLRGADILYDSLTEYKKQIFERKSNIVQKGANTFGPNGPYDPSPAIIPSKAHGAKDDE